MRVLVTGGAGFIVSHIAEHYAAKAEVRVLDNLRSGDKANLDGLGVEFIEGSVTDRRAVKKAVDGVDYISHLAANAYLAENESYTGVYNVAYGKRQTINVGSIWVSISTKPSGPVRWAMNLSAEDLEKSTVSI